jgi:hypothetical protein
MSTIRDARDLQNVVPQVRLLDVDFELVGSFPPEPLLRAMGDRVVVLRNEAGRLCVELVDPPDASLEDKLTRFSALVGSLPEDARRSWDSAVRRVFDIGIQSGLEPRRTEWTLPSHVLAAIVALRADVRLTIYGTAPTAREVDTSRDRAAGRRLRIGVARNGRIIADQIFGPEADVTLGGDAAATLLVPDWSGPPVPLFTAGGWLHLGP